jgi:tol-pal system protein YbgF
VQLVRRFALCLCLGLPAGCALKGDVRKVELQVQALQGERARADTAQRQLVDSVLEVLAVVQRALTAQQAYLVQVRGDVRTDLLSVQQQLVTLQELAGVSQQRLSEMRSQLEQRAQQPVPDVSAAGGQPAAGGAQPPVGASGNPAGPGPAQMWDVAMQQFRAGRYSTARLALRELLRVFPNDEHAPDALFYVGETFAQDTPDSAAAVYGQVVKQFSNSPRAPSALYKLGLLAEQRNDKATARTFYNRVIAGYPRSDEANLARDKLQRLGR